MKWDSWLFNGIANFYLLDIYIYLQDSQRDQSPIVDLQKRLGVSISSSKAHVNLVDEIDDKELIELSSRLAGESLPTRDQVACLQVFWGSRWLNYFSLLSASKLKFLVGEMQALREHWKNSTASSIQLRELGPLLRDYQRLIVHHHAYAHFCHLPMLACFAFY